MNLSRFKRVVIVVLSLIFFAALSLTIFSSGSAYAMGRKPPLPVDKGDSPVSVPEPATWLLIGSGVGALVLFRKKLKK